MDDTDRHLLAALKENARASTAELGRRLGLSRTTVQSRIERLERRGIVAGYTVRLADAHEAGLIRAQVMIAAPPKAARAVEAAIRAIPQASALYSISGGFDLIAILAASSVGELDAVIDQIGALEGVERTSSSIILSTKFER